MVPLEVEEKQWMEDKEGRDIETHKNIHKRQMSKKVRLYLGWNDMRTYVLSIVKIFFTSLSFTICNT